MVRIMKMTRQEAIEIYSKWINKKDDNIQDVPFGEDCTLGSFSKRMSILVGGGICAKCPNYKGRDKERRVVLCCNRKLTIKVLFAYCNVNYSITNNQ